MAERRHRRKRDARSHGLRTHKEIAEIMTRRGYPMSKERVHEIEHNALRKLRRGLEEIGVTREDL